MPIPEDVVKVNLNFTTSVEEIAVASFHVQRNHTTGAQTNWPEDLTDLAEKVYTRWGGNMGTTIRELFPTSLKLRDVSVYHLNAASGKTQDKGIFVPLPANVWAGINSGPALPLECAVAVSLYGYQPGSFVADRARHRGRIFLPPMASSIMAGPDPVRVGRLEQSPWTALTGFAESFFNDMQNMTIQDDIPGVGDNWELVVLSRTGGFTTPVQAIRVGDVVDVQRRRRNKQREAYKDAAIVR